MILSIFAIVRIKDLLDVGGNLSKASNPKPIKTRLFSRNEHVWEHGAIPSPCILQYALMIAMYKNSKKRLVFAFFFENFP